MIIIRSSCLVEIRWSVNLSKSQRSLCVSFSGTGSGFCIYHLFVRSNYNLLQNFQWITLPIQSCLVLYSFCACLLHSLILWLINSSPSSQNLHLLFFFVFYLFLLWYNLSLWCFFLLLLEENFSLKVSLL